MNTEEMQEMLATFENRISFLENSLPGSAMSYQPKEQEGSSESLELIIQTDRIEQNEKYKQIDRIVRQFYHMRNEMTYVHNEVNEIKKLLGMFGDVPKKEMKGKYEYF